MRASRWPALGSSLEDRGRGDSATSGASLVTDALSVISGQFPTVGFTRHAQSIH
jgi:hypothetical protein